MNIDQTKNPSRTDRDTDISAKRFDALYFGRGSEFRKVLDQLYETNPRAASAFQRLGEVQVATGSYKPWLINHHLSMAVFNAADEVSRHLTCPVDSLDAFWLREHLEVISRLHEFLNSRLEAAVWGLADLGYPAFAERWQDWQNIYCNGVMGAFTLTSPLRGDKRFRQRLKLCIENLKDTLPELQQLFRDMRAVVSGDGWWADSSVVEFLSEDD
jgi:hypothetical protein